MTRAFDEKGRKSLAWVLLAILYFETIVPAYAAEVRNSPPPAIKKERRLPAMLMVSSPIPVPAANPVMTVGKLDEPYNGGPTQPESQAFQSVSSANMVDLFTGDFSYSIPLIDVGGYPLALGYSSGISMDQEASWCGLGWNINPGSIMRNVRGVPDDFNGEETINRTASVKPNKTMGVTAGAAFELGGFPMDLSANLGLFHNTYRGWGLEAGINPSINVGAASFGKLTAGLSLTANSQEGFSPSASLDYATNEMDMKNMALSGTMSTSIGFNSRSGLKDLQFTGGVRLDKKQQQNAQKRKKDEKPGWEDRLGGKMPLYNTSISFATTSVTPKISMPFTSENYSINIKVGTELKILVPSLSLGGYISKQYIAKEDTLQKLPAYGYLHFDHGQRNQSAMLDFNREREIPYREKPELPNIAVPFYTYDVFSISGEGIGGSFRAYRSDVGYIYDNYMRTKDKSNSGSLDLGFGDLVHVGVDITITRSQTESGPWTSSNPMASKAKFTAADKTFEPVYFRNPGEKTINSKQFYDALGGDDVVFPTLTKTRGLFPNLATTGQLTRFRNGKKQEEIVVPQESMVKKERDKRTQVISYLTAGEASEAGCQKYIESYGVNQYVDLNCDNEFPIDTDQDGEGVKWEIFTDRFMTTKTGEKTVPYFAWHHIGYFVDAPDWPNSRSRNAEFGNRWTGRLKALTTGEHIMEVISDDGFRLYLQDTVLNRWYDKTRDGRDYFSFNLEKDKVYDLKIEHYNKGLPPKTRNGEAGFVINWKTMDVSTRQLYLPAATDTFAVDSGRLVKEKRVNNFRKKSHLSQVDVLNSDGRRYVYGIPVYNFIQKDVTFAANHQQADKERNTVTYTDRDISTQNDNGQDGYFNKEVIPAYAHTFLLTGIMSPDYVDATGNGISDDDPGNAIKFNYSKTAGERNPYKWRTPHGKSASYNEGLRSYNRDDKGSYVYGEKELWYLHTIESKNMIATFTLEDREDMISVQENGEIETNNKSAKRLKEINLYAKAEFLKFKERARPIKTVHFEYSYELCRDATTYPGRESGKLTLKKVWFSYNGNKKGQKNAYVFHYNQKNPQYNGQSFDRWGNFKDAKDNPGSVHGNIVTNAEFPYSLQDSSIAAQNAGAWALDSIHLPSGGRIKVTYESDDYGFVQHKRAAVMLQVAGFSPSVPTALGQISNKLYDPNDNLYVSIHVPVPVTSKEDVRQKYLDGIDDLYFRLNVKMPSDMWGSGYEFVPGYARVEPGGYGFYNDGKTIWIKVKSLDKRGLDGGSFSPFAKTAAQFLRLNLPSKAYPGSETGDMLDGEAAIKMIASMGNSIINTFRSYDASVRATNFCREVDLARSHIRLHEPSYKKYGGGHRVKRVMVYDNWKKMADQKESTYGTDYIYTTTRDLGGRQIEISSGVATYEPMLGGEENPWRTAIAYTEQVAALAPVTMGYVETPLGESFFPGASVGYSRVRTKSVKTDKTRSANGFSESCYYTAYDFPVITDHSLLNGDSKQKYAPALGKFLKINAVHHMAVAQGFKVELNDMHGKLRSTSTYSAIDATSPISSTTYYYKVDNVHAEHKHLNNDVMSMGANGVIDANASVGKDLELMMDMRQQKSVSMSVDKNANVDIFSFGFPPVLGYPSGYVFPHRQETMFRSAAATKVIQRYGILDSTVAIDKGSKVVTRNLLFDAETGDAILTATQNEFNDTIFNFTYPAGWMYEGMSGAYKNIGATFSGVYFKGGKLVSGFDTSKVNDYFVSGDELLVYSRNAITDDICNPKLASFRSATRVWAVDANVNEGDKPRLYFVDAEGNPFNGNESVIKIIRSGRRNIAAPAGTVAMMENPLVRTTGGGYILKIDETSRITHAEMIEYKEMWQVEDRKKQKVVCFF